MPQYWTLIGSQHPFSNYTKEQLLTNGLEFILLLIIMFL